MKNLWRRILCLMLVVFSFIPICLVSAAEMPNSSFSQVAIEDNNPEISPRWNDIALDSPITSNGAAWYQQESCTAFRLWVDNTTGALMTVTITFPSGQTKNVYVTAGSNKSYTNNDAEYGVYRVSFHTYASTLSGTIRVRVSTTPLL